MENKLRGVWTALVSPFKNQQLDLNSFERCVRSQIEAGIHGLVVAGTTGESASLADTEKEALLKMALKIVNGQIPVFLGTGTNDTQETIRQTSNAKKWGASGALVVTPYYNKPPQEGLVQHYLEVAKIEIPILLYNVPSRTAVHLSNESVCKLADHPNIVGLKDATGNLTQAADLFQKLKGKKAFAVFSGDDESYINLVRLGAVGVISVLSHIYPKECIQCYDEKSELSSGLLAHIKLLFEESNPIPVKHYLYKMKLLDSDQLRLPLVSCSYQLSQKIDEEMRLEL